MPLSPFNIPSAHYLIGGNRPPASAMIAVTAPSTGGPLTHIGRGTAHDIDAAVAVGPNGLEGRTGRDERAGLRANRP